MSETVNSEAKRITAAELFGSSENSALAELSASENADAKASTATSEAQNEPENKQDAEKESKENGLTDDGDVSSDDAESTDDEAQDEDDGEKKAAKGKGVTKRIQKLVRKNKALEQELMFLREQILKSQVEGKSTQAKDVSLGKGGKDDLPPHPDDFESWEDYEAARISYYSNKAVREATQPLLEEIKKLSGAKAETEAQKAVKEFEKRQKEFAKTHSDYMDVVSNLEGIHVDASVEQAIVHSALGPEILYELGKNPDLAEEIAELPPHLQIKEIGKLEAKIEARLEAKKLAAAKPTKAPPPLNPVGQKSDGRKSIDDPNLSTLEFFTLRNEQERKRWGDFL